MYFVYRKMNLNIVSKGQADTVVSANGKKRTSSLSWDGNMKKGKGKLHIKMNNNGEKLDKTMNFTEQDLVKLLSVPAVNKDIDQRLFNNYLSPSTMPMREPLEIQTFEFSGHPAVELGDFPEDGLESLSVLPFKQMDTKNTLTPKKALTKKRTTKKKSATKKKSKSSKSKSKKSKSKSKK